MVYDSTYKRAGSVVPVAAEVVVVCAAEFAAECARTGMLAVMRRHEVVFVVGGDVAPCLYKRNGENGWDKVEAGDLVREDVVGGLRMWIERTEEESSVGWVGTASMAMDKVFAR